MGYASYDTPLGEAGYAVEDVCHQDGCNEQIDRGLAFLCGDQPGEPCEIGCGRWFCADHLFMSPEEAGGICGGGLCEECLDAYTEENPGWEEREEARIQQRAAELRAAREGGGQS